MKQLCLEENSLLPEFRNSDTLNVLLFHEAQEERLPFMTQTTNKQNDSESRRGRPGQRQQERLMRIERRRVRRWRILQSIVALVIIGVGAWVIFWGYPAYTANQQAIQNQHVTATAKVNNLHATA